MQLITLHIHIGPADNRNLVDDNTAQTMSASDIHALKASGAGGAAIVAALAAASTTFASKTAFSQAKYIAKKTRKRVAPW
jgi:tRNA (adenine-N(1)-)-methyltransferase non-catalytic subunit